MDSQKPRSRHRPDSEDRGPFHLKALRFFGPIEPRAGAFFLVWLAFLPVALAAVGAAVAYQLTGSLWSTPLGLLAGLVVAGVFVRDFIRWRVSVFSIIAWGIFITLFALSQGLLGA
jgi:hypothetical protein